MYHRLGSLQTTGMYFLRFWRLEVQDQGMSSRSGVCCRPTFCSQEAVFSLCPHVVGALRCLFIKSTNPIMRLNAQDPVTSQRYTSYNHPSGDKASTFESGEHSLQQYLKSMRQLNCCVQWSECHLQVAHTEHLGAVDMAHPWPWAKGEHLYSLATSLLIPV